MNISVSGCGAKVQRNFGDDGINNQSLPLRIGMPNQLGIVKRSKQL